MWQNVIGKTAKNAMGFSINERDATITMPLFTSVRQCIFCGYPFSIFASRLKRPASAVPSFRELLITLSSSSISAEDSFLREVKAAIKAGSDPPKASSTNRSDWAAKNCSRVMRTETSSSSFLKSPFSHSFRSTV